MATVWWVLIAWFNDCIWDKSSKMTVNPIIVKVDPILYVNIYVCKSINCKLRENSHFTNQLIDTHNSKPIPSVTRYGAEQLLPPPLPLSSEWQAIVIYIHCSIQWQKHLYLRGVGTGPADSVAAGPMFESTVMIQLKSWLAYSWHLVVIASTVLDVSE